METLFDTSASTLECINDSVLEQHQVKLWVKRDDKIDSDVSGNKWRKLKYNVLQCEHNRNEGVLTFGGAFSNHLVATASACHRLGMRSVGVVRGDELHPQSNETLQRCYDLGMHLHFVSREEYYLRGERFYQEELLAEFPNLWIVPEGGANYMGMIGCQELLGEITVPFDRIVVAQGTTTTSCGILLGLSLTQRVTVIPVLKGFESDKEMRHLMGKSGIDPETIHALMESTDVLDTYHFGGYAKVNDELVEFIIQFYQKHQMKLDPVYTGKAMFGLWEEIKAGKYDGETIVFLHTGGLQGINGMEQRLERKFFP